MFAPCFRFCRALFLRPFAEAFPALAAIQPPFRTQSLGRGPTASASHFLRIHGSNSVQSLALSCQSGESLNWRGFRRPGRGRQLARVRLCQLEPEVTRPELAQRITSGPARDSRDSRHPTARSAARTEAFRRGDPVCWKRRRPSPGRRRPAADT
jgi:hypothetical protein